MLPTDAPAVEARSRIGALAAVLGTAFIVRVWGIGFGLPLADVRPDEMLVVGKALRFLTGDLNPHFFEYPSLFLYLVGAVIAVSAGFSVIAGGSVEEILAAAAVDPSPYILMGRWLSLFAGVGTVAVVYKLGRRLAGTDAGLAAALFLAVSPLHSRDSHFATTDVTMALFLSLGVWALLGVYQRGRTRDYALAGLFSGLAVSTKYVGLIMPGAMAVAHLLRFVPQLRDQGLVPTARKAWNAPGPWVFMGVGVCAFVLTSPYALIDWGIFTNSFMSQMSHLSGGHGLDLGIGAVYHIRHTLPKGLGWPVVLGAAGGTLLALRRDPAKAIVLLAFPVLFFASTARGRTVFLRYMIPLLPFVCVLAGYGVQAVRKRLPADRKWVAALLAAAMAASPLVRSVQIDRVLARRDSRVLAAQWLSAEAGPSLATVYQSGSRFGHLVLPPQVDSLATLALLVAGDANTPESVPLREYQRLQARARLAEREGSVLQVGGFRTVPFDSVRGFPPGELPDWIVLSESPLVLYSEVPSGLAEVIASEYTEVHRVEGVPVEGPGWYDQLDALFLPITGLRSVSRPGPTVTIFRLRPRPGA